MSTNIPLEARSQPFGRVAATILDGLVFLPAVWLVFALAGPPWDTVFAVIAQMIYRVCCDIRWGRTIGKHVFRLRVCHGQNGTTLISPQTALVREGSAYMPALVAAPFLDHPQTWLAVAALMVPLWLAVDVGFLLLTEEHRALHDLLSGTIVVRFGHRGSGASTARRRRAEF